MIVTVTLRNESPQVFKSVEAILQDQETTNLKLGPTGSISFDTFDLITLEVEREEDLDLLAKIAGYEEELGVDP